jgi:outer membrane autotransporter protein
MVASADGGMDLLLRAGYARGADRVFAEHDNACWLSNVSNWSGQKTTSSTPGFRSFDNGTAIGFDHRFSDELTAGMSLGYTQTTINWFNGFGHGMVEALHSSLYGRWTREGLHADGELGLGYDWFTQTREIVGLDRKADSDHTGYEYMARIGGGYDWLGDTWAMGPVGWLQYVNLHEDGFSEHGADAMDLSVGGRDSDSLQSGLGVRAARQLSFASTRIVPSARAEWVHEYQPDARSMRAALGGAPGSPFTVTGLGAARDSVVIGTGLDAMLTRNLTLGLKYDLWLPCNTTSMVSHSLCAILQYAF